MAFNPLSSPGGIYPPGAIAFIGCSKSKRKENYLAQEMYQGELFKKALKYCKINFDHIYILSAKYGLLSLDQQIEPYDQTLNTMSKKERQIWYDLVWNQIKKFPEHLIYFFCGENYHLPFRGNKPLQGLSIGKQLQWFNQNMPIIRQEGFNL